MGLIRTDKSNKKLHVRSADDNFRRAKDIAYTLSQLINLHHVRAICFESFSPVRSASVAAQLGTSYGVLATLVTVHRLPIACVTPQETRKILHAESKEDVAQIAYQRHKIAGKRAMIQFAKEYGNNGGDHNHAWDSIGIFEACKDSDIIRALRR